MNTQMQEFINRRWYAGAVDPMRTDDDLMDLLHSLDGRGYKAYKRIRGRYRFHGFTLAIDHVQGDPYAAPSKCRIIASYAHEYPPETMSTPVRAIACRDFLARRFASSIQRYAQGYGSRGSGKSGTIGIDTPGQTILERTAVGFDTDRQRIEVRFTVGLPAFGRRIAGRQAAEMFGRELPAIVDDALPYPSLDEAALMQHIECAEDADALRRALEPRGLVAVVADGACLPRRSGIDDRPLDDAVPFRSPPELRQEFELPNRTITGMGIPAGITLIVGGGFHGKSTLLTAIQDGVYNHIPGDGREFVVAAPSTAKIRAEDGRSITAVDISPFIAVLPQQIETTAFTTPNASGSTSQAANIVEALEAGAKVLLIDEDTSATNFMIRDQRMQRLVPKQDEPITPFIDRARQLVTEHGVSTILVIGGSGAYFDIADTVICMIEYRPHDRTAEARAIVDELPANRAAEGTPTFGSMKARYPQPRSLDPRTGKRRRVKIKAHDRATIQFGRTTIDLSALEQLVDTSQTRAIGLAIEFAKQFMHDRAMPEVLDEVEAAIAAGSLDVLDRYTPDRLAAFRRIELAGALNRVRTLDVDVRQHEQDQPGQPASQPTGAREEREKEEG